MTAAAKNPDPNVRQPGNGSLLVIFLTVFIDLLGFGMMLPLLPLYAKRFGVSEHGWEIGALMSCFSLMQFIFAPLWGRLSDRIGRRPVLIVGLAGSVVFYALCGLATQWQSLIGLFIARIGAGISGATISTAQAYIADTTTPQTRARGMALIGVAFGLGFTFGPLLAFTALSFSQVSPISVGRSAAPSPVEGTVEKVEATADAAAENAAATSPWPGFVAAGLSAIALALAIFRLPESFKPGAPAMHVGLFDSRSLRDALATPTIAALLITSFISVVSFGGYETTIAMLLEDKQRGFGVKFHHVPLFFAFIGITLSLVQGGLVRRLSGKLPELTLIAVGCTLTVLGFVLLTISSLSGMFPLVMIASAVEVAGFAFMAPTLQSLISRRSDPEKQGGILGVSQGVSALARIVGPLMAVPLFKSVSPVSPYFASIGLMLIGMMVLFLGARGGRDYGAAATEGIGH